jgi:hypothetical protein
MNPIVPFTLTVAFVLTGASALAESGILSEIPGNPRSDTHYVFYLRPGFTGECFRFGRRSIGSSEAAMPSSPVRRISTNTKKS